MREGGGGKGWANSSTLSLLVVQELSLCGGLFERAYLGVMLECLSPHPTLPLPGHPAVEGGAPWGVGGAPVGEERRGAAFGVIPNPVQSDYSLKTDH